MTFERRDTNGLSMLVFPASAFSLYVDSVSGSEAYPHSPDEALSLSGADAVADGPMFDVGCNGAGGGDYPSYQCGEVLYRHYDPDAGVNIASSRPNQGVTISVMPDGTTQAAFGDSPQPGARVAVQLYPALVVNGTPQLASSETFNYVAALAVLSDGQMAFVIGRNMSLVTFAQRLASAGAVFAGYTDGGGSAAIVTPTQYIGSSEHRRVLTWLVARAQTASPAAQKGALIVGAGLLGLAAWWLLRKRR